MLLAAGFVCLYAAALTLAPAVRLHTWQTEMRWAHWLGVAVWMFTFALLHRLLLRQLPDRDPYLLPAAALLTGWGLMTIWRPGTPVWPAPDPLAGNFWRGVCPRPAHP